MKRFIFLLGIFFGIFFHFSFSQTTPPEYQVLKNIPVPGNGGWDYLTVDHNTARLFISHGNVVDVLNLRSEKIVGQIQNTSGVHGIACTHEFDKGYISAGKLDSVIVFNLTTLEVLKKIKTGQNPDAIIYDPYSKLIFIGNGKSNSITAINAKTDQVAGTIPLSGKPEAIVADGRGKVFCNIEDKSTLVKIDVFSLKVESEWSLKPGKEPTGLAINLKDARLYSACSKSKQIIVMNGANGTMVDTIPIGEGCDGLAFIPEDQTIIASCGDGTMIVVLQKNPDKFEVIQTLKTKKGARTMTFGRVVRKMYLPYAEMTMENGKRKITPGTFGILVIGKK